jgi:hypothetical protein
MVIEALRVYDAAVNKKLNNKEQVEAIAAPLEGAAWDEYKDQDADPYKPEASIPDVKYYPEETFDKNILVQALWPNGDFRDFDGNASGSGKCKLSSR